MKPFSLQWIRRLVVRISLPLLFACNGDFGIATDSMKESTAPAEVGVELTADSGSNLLANPGFESGATNWVVSGNVITSSTGQPAHSGNWKAWLNGYGRASTESLSQTVSIPSTATSARLSFWLHIGTTETTTTQAYDSLEIQVQDGSGAALATLATYSNLDKNAGYVEKAFDLAAYKGQSVRLFIKGTEDSSLKSSFVLDDVALATDGSSTPTANCASAPTSSVVVNVKNTGAVGDGSTDDTAALQAAVDQVPAGGTVYVPDGTYMVEAVTAHLKLKSNMTLRLSSGATLKAKPTSSDSYSVLLVQNASNVNIIGGTVQGERQGHLAAGRPDSAYGIGIRLDTANLVVVDAVTVRDNWGDGIYVGNGSFNSTFCSVTADNNRRQGLSITYANGVVVKNSVFKNSNGAIPGSGIDIESGSGQSVSNVQIVGSTFTGNAGGGIRSALEGGTVAASSVVIDGNTMSNNLVAGIDLLQTRGMRVINNTVTNNLGEGIQVAGSSTNNTIDHNTVTGNNRNGILLAAGSDNNTISSNTVTGNLLGQIVNNGAGNVLTNNTGTPTRSCAPPPTSSVVVNVKNTGATGNGSTDDTAAIQAAINQVSSGGTVYVPDGTYMIEAVNTHVKLKSNMTLSMSSGAVLKARPYSGGSSVILLLDHVTNVNIIGGTVDGNRAQHDPAVCGSYGTPTYCGEYGMGISSYGGSNLYYDGVIAKNCWGDGIYVGGAPSETPPANVNLCRVTADFNRRQGMSVISVDGMVVRNSIFKNTEGTAPQAGIDLEPNAGNAVKNVRIVNSVFTGNRGPGVELYGGSTGSVVGISVSGCTVSGNTNDWGIVAFNSKNSTFSNNVVQNNWQGITLNSDTSGITVSNNIVSLNRSADITNNGSGNTITGNNTTAALQPIPNPL